jgi:hypothetical protein
MAKPDPPIHLTYGRQAPAWRRRRTFVIASIVLAAILGGWLAPRQIREVYYLGNYRREAKRWYTAALIWTEPPTKLKYTENPADSPNGSFPRLYMPQGSIKMTGFKSFGGGFVERRPLFSGGRQVLFGTADDCMLFMHARTTTGGELTRLIAVGRPTFRGNLMGVDCDQIGLLKGEYRILRGGYKQIDMTGICAAGEIRVFAGQPNPKDPSRFSIPFEARGRKGYIDGVYQTGESFSDDPAKARAEMEINSDIVLTIRMLPATTTIASITTAPAK